MTPKEEFVSEEIVEKEEDVETEKSISKKDVLVLKKSPIETKIFVSILSKFTTLVDSASNLEELHSKLKENCYKLVIFDKELKNTSYETIKDVLTEVKELHCKNDISTIMFVDPSSDIMEDEKAAFDEVLPNAINKSQLEKLVEKYIKREYEE